MKNRPNIRLSKIERHTTYLAGRILYNIHTGMVMIATSRDKMRYFDDSSTHRVPIPLNGAIYKLNRTLSELCYDLRESIGKIEYEKED